MPTSSTIYKQEVKEYLISKFHPNIRILDVGAGEGTYYDLLSDYFKNIDAVEVFKPYIDKYNLKDKYNEVFNKNIKDFKYVYYDAIIFGDIIEHLSIEEAQEVLDYAKDRCKELIVAVPYQNKQGIEEGNVYEIHKQDDLTPKNMLERYPMLKELYRDNNYGYYVKEENKNV